MQIGLRLYRYDRPHGRKKAMTLRTIHTVRECGIVIPRLVTQQIITVPWIMMDFTNEQKSNKKKIELNYIRKIHLQRFINVKEF